MVEYGVIRNFISSSFLSWHVQDQNLGALYVRQPQMNDSVFAYHLASFLLWIVRWVLLD
jgi:hypothetical protein